MPWPVLLTHPLAILGALALCVVAAELLARHTWLRHGGTALTVIVLTAVLANLRIIPSSTGDVPLYSALFFEISWMAIFLLLLEVRLLEVVKAGRQILILFALAVLSTTLGAWVGVRLAGGAEVFGEHLPVLAGMFTATYTGGSANFVAIASQYRMTDGVLLAGANAVDAGMTTVWMAVTVVVPRLLLRWRPELAAGRMLSGERGGSPVDRDLKAELVEEIEQDSETLHPLDLGILLALAAFSVRLSIVGAEWFESVTGFALPGILILTSLALLLAQLPRVQRLRGGRTLGLFGVYLFLAVIGALCDLEALRESGAVGLGLLVMVCVLLLVHGAVVFGSAVALRLDPDTAAVASQASIGGGTSALALARSLGRSDLVLPAILIGALGNGVGTYLGVMVVTLLS
ncbi:MAG: DUF819 family protein [Acidobacteria bacterium]|nr:MAG: DUF819 family protein [Acidobacteriota bacterium]REK09268.1 MAG: DUF819 family protein [Acidobacteriota bacterium]